MFHGVFDNFFLKFGVRGALYFGNGPKRCSETPQTGIKNSKLWVVALSNTAKNNVWGSILKEDALTSDLTSIAVGRKSVKDLNSDRGAEVTLILLFMRNNYYI